MNPEQTRTSHEAATLEAARNELLTPTGDGGRVFNARNVLAQTKASAREGKSRWFGFRGDKGKNDAAEAAKIAHDKQTNDFIQIEARRLADQLRPIGGGELNTDQYRDVLAEQVAQLAIQEQMNLTVKEIELAEASDKGWRGKIRTIMRNAVVRTVVGWGLNAGIGVAVAHGNVPLAAALVGARVGFGAMGTEGMMRGITNGTGDRAKLSREHVFGSGATPGMNDMAEINRRLDAFAEMRIRDRRSNVTGTENLLLQRKGELMALAVRSKLTAENVTNWREYRGETTLKQAELATKTTEKTAAEAVVAQENQNIATATADMTDRERRVSEEEAKHERATTELEAARNAKIAADAVLAESTDPTRAVGGFIKLGADRARVEAAARTHVAADKEIARLRALNPPPANLNTLVNAQTVLREPAHTELYNLTWNIEAIVDAWKDLKDADTKIASLPVEIANADTESANQAQEVNNARQRKLAVEAAKIAAEARVTAIAGEISRLQLEITEANNLSEDQAILVYNILVGGGARAAVGTSGTTGYRPDISAVASANSILGQESASTKATTAMDRERSLKRRRWLGALLVSGIVTAATTPGSTEYFNLPWATDVQAAEPIQQAAQTATEVALNIKDTILLPQGSNPWNEAAGILRQALGHEATNNQIMQLTQEISKNSGISVPNWGIEGAIDHHNLRPGLLLKLGKGGLNLISQFKAGA